jgi:uncharacterized membrane protein YkoI
MPTKDKQLQLEADGKVHVLLSLPRAKKLAVDTAMATLSDVLLMQAGREATGHGIYIDAKTLQTALDAVTMTGGQVRGYYTHDHRGGWMNGWENLVEASASEMAIPGYFDTLRIEKDQLIAGTFTFYDTFRAAHPETVSQVLEMAEKTPALLAQSLELWGYAVYVAADGTEYSQEPEDEDLQYNGMPAMRVTDVFGSAFVAAGAATDGLFARLARKISGAEIPAETVAQLKTIFAAFAAEQAQERTQEQDKDMNLIKALKAAIKDEARLARALAIVAGSDTPDNLTADIILAKLDAEDTAKKQAEAAALAAKASDTEAQLAAARAKTAELEAQLAQVRNLGVEKPLNLGTLGTGEGRQLTGISAKLAPKYAEKGINLSISTISSMIVPEIWIQGMATEPVVEKSNIMDSPMIASNPLFVQIASGAGTSAQMPFFKEPNFEDEIQVESTAPSYNGVSQIKAVSPILNRVSSFGASALAAQVSGTDPVGECLRYLGTMRKRQRQASIISVLRGGFGAHTDTTAALEEIRKNNCTTTGSIAEANQIDLSLIRSAATLLGENWATLVALWVHPDILTALSDQDVTDYITPSEGGLFLKGYRGCVIYTSSLLKTTATINSVPSVPIYRSYLMSARSVGIGEKPQSTMIGDVASITEEALASINDRKVFDRTRFVLGLNGLSWKGTPGGQSATNAELATIANWELAKNGDTTFDPRNVGIAEIVTNG